MKKKIVFLAAICSLVVVAHATTLRVNNTDSSAPYADINDAVKAAVDGDTIMVEGSSVKYADAILDKRVVLVGPGYWLRDNGIVSESGYDARLDYLTSTAEGTVIMGMYITQQIKVQAPRTIITRCSVVSAVNTSISMVKGTDNCVITQNFLAGGIGGVVEHETYRHQITNNLIEDFTPFYIYDSYIGYNTIYDEWRVAWSHGGNKIEKNLVNGLDFSQTNEFTKSNYYADNYFAKDLFTNTVVSIKKDRDVRDYELPEGTKDYGAFAGDTPYVISGVPTGPIIEELTIPTSVEEGSIMEVTVKLGSAK